MTNGGNVRHEAAGLSWAVVMPVPDGSVPMSTKLKSWRFRVVLPELHRGVLMGKSDGRECPQGAHSSEGFNPYR